MKPDKLSWVTVPLIILLVLDLLALLVLPIVAWTVSLGLNASPEVLAEDPALAEQAEQLAAVFTGAMLWVSALVIVGWAALLFVTYRAVQAGRAWGRIAATVVFVLSLFSFPIGTILGVFGLIGVFDRDVQRYTSG